MSPLFPIMAATVGFTVAIPFGPVNLEIIRRTLNHQTKAALVFGLGAASADGLWPVVAFIGIAPLLEIQWVSIIFWSIGTILIGYLGVNAIRESNGLHRPTEINRKTLGKRVSFFMGFSLVLSNPLNLVAWVTTLGAFHAEGILPEANKYTASILWLSVMLGTYILFLSVIFIVRRYKHFITESPIEKKVKMIFGPLLLIISAYFAYNLYLNLSSLF